jgi:hypothetical protein
MSSLTEVKWILLSTVISSKILEFLEIYTYLQAREVCTNWRNALIDRKSINMGCKNSISFKLPLILNNTILKNVIQLNLRKCNLMNCHLLYLKNLVNLQKLDLSYNPKITNEGFTHLYNLTNLRILNLENSKNITDTGLNQFTNFDKLEELNIADCDYRIDDHEFQYLNLLINLKVLNVSAFNFSHINLKYLANISQLTSLCLSRCILIDELYHLHMLKNLLHLDLSHCYNMTNNNLYHLKAFTKLLTLDISECYSITDDGLYHLNVLENLEKLLLFDCNITNKSIVHLNNCKNLTWIDIQCTKITDYGLGNIRCGISYTW